MGLDQRLIAAATSGDAAAFSALVERHRAELQVHAYRMLGSLENAQDAVQDALLRAWRSRATPGVPAQRATGVRTSTAKASWRQS